MIKSRKQPFREALEKKEKLSVTSIYTHETLTGILYNFFPLFYLNIYSYLGKKKLTKRKRCCKKDIKEKNYKCDDCSKSYLSFPALYTHKRNKHNIIPITGKQDIFKSFQFSIMSNFSYSSFGNNTDLVEICNYLKEEMKGVLNQLYLEPSSQLYESNFQVDKYPLLEHFEFLKNASLELKLPKKHENQSIDRMLSLYILLLTEVTRENFFTTLSIKMVVLLRQYLNMVGWGNLKSYHDFKVYTHEYIQEGEFTEKNDPEEIPGLINEFNYTLSISFKINFINVKINCNQWKKNHIN